MLFNDFYQQLDQKQRERFAKRCRTTTEYLSLIARGHSQAGVKLAKRMAVVAGKDAALPALGLSDIRPDIWQPPSRARGS